MNVRVRARRSGRRLDPVERTVRLEFWLPFPPSSNRLWRYDRGRLHLSAGYTKWLRQADDAAQDQELCDAPSLGRYAIEVKLSERFIGRGDADNRLKAVSDWCQRAHLIVDDRDCRRASIEWTNIAHECTVTLTGEIAYASKAATAAR